MAQPPRHVTISPMLLPVPGNAFSRSRRAISRGKPRFGERAIEGVGSNVVEFEPGDRVAAFHEIMSPYGSYTKYPIAWQQGAATPLASMTSAAGFYACLGLPRPRTPATETTPLIIYGVGSAVGTYVVQLARRRNIHPLVCFAGKSRSHAETLIDTIKGDVAERHRLPHAFDVELEHNSYVNPSKVHAEDLRITLVLPSKDYAFSADTARSLTLVGFVRSNAKDFGFVYFWYIALVPGGLRCIQEALENLKVGKASAIKYVFGIAYTQRT
ncbi:alcohol dehydrogenase-like protein [Durotheca rogersii]|uniref:alcohol dehydrogenase-like protein n=1 Tax=Durotheca rogersii TaxID=419775 RepID=UPI00221FF937|nr:alcohol dehydrogenase-like protein [Durotheca rogersii]KAI5855113.1 alcohol dehydrogenase-like protein [Durotheca rogersii]